MGGTVVSVVGRSGGVVTDSVAGGTVVGGVVVTGMVSDVVGGTMVSVEGTVG